jgi:2-amino-4-hydroxy-6-hydroxymethyldihydropteridine diphosphokinase
MHIRGFIGLGSNLGDPQGNIARALKAVDEVPGLTLVAVSSMFRTEPQGLRDQAWFINCVARVDVAPTWTPHELLAVLSGIETVMGRVRHVRFGPRVIDMDILLLGDVQCEDNTLHIPHPRMVERAFVLVPLMQLAPDILIQGQTPAQWLSRLTYSVQGDLIRQPQHTARGT